MNLRALSVLLVVAALLAAPKVYAQHEGTDANPLGDDRARTRVLIGPVGGIALSHHTGGFRIINESSCPVFTDGNAWGYFLGLSGEVQPGATWSIIPRITYESRPGRFHQQLEGARILVDSVTVADQVVSATSTVDMRLLNFEVMYAQQLFRLGKSFRLNVNAGPAVGYVLSGKITQVQDLEEPLNAQFVNPNGLPTENNGRRLIYAQDQTISGLQNVRFSVKGGLVAELGLFNNEWILYPGIFYDFGITNVTRNENWSLNTLLFQLELRRAL